MVRDFLKMSLGDLAAPHVDTQVDDAVSVRGVRVACDGDGGAGHPRVWLTLDAVRGRVRCPYCSRTFVGAPEPEAESESEPEAESEPESESESEPESGLE